MTQTQSEQEFQRDLDALLARKAGATDIYERILREMSSDNEWAVIHRRLHPEEYPPPKKLSLWRRVLRGLFGVDEVG